MSVDPGKNKQAGALWGIGGMLVSLITPFYRPESSRWTAVLIVLIWGLFISAAFNAIESRLWRKATFVIITIAVAIFGYNIWPRLFSVDPGSVTFFTDRENESYTFRAANSSSRDMYSASFLLVLKTKTLHVEDFAVSLPQGSRRPMAEKAPSNELADVQPMLCFEKTDHPSFVFTIPRLLAHDYREITVRRKTRSGEAEIHSETDFFTQDPQPQSYDSDGKGGMYRVKFNRVLGTCHVSFFSAISGELK